ncbi:hypothetical protein KFK09_010294 [Dendrobium nobile]|uniref:Uncharacterized protein n=1 Tax=Dendrobium nobile TaxID=94219 RepID=A0A8T3BNH2_DENNO|nr:hypothetical protein KFK09_010294 [Dendrobium nobile]
MSVDVWLGISPTSVGGPAEVRCQAEVRHQAVVWPKFGYQAMVRLKSGIKRWSGRSLSSIGGPAKVRCQKSVQITVYVVKPRMANHEHVSGHRRRPLRNCGGAAGYDRKAQLLLYSQQLRNIACCEFQAPRRQKTETLKKVKEVIQIVSGYKSQEQVKEVLKIRTHQKVAENLKQIASSNRQPPSTKKVVPEELQKPVHAKSPQPHPSCFPDWRSVLLPSFIERIFGSRNGKDDDKNKKKLSVSLSEKMNAIMMSSTIEKKRIGLMAKFLSVTGKRS